MVVSPLDHRYAQPSLFSQYGCVLNLETSQFDPLRIGKSTSLPLGRDIPMKTHHPCAEKSCSGVGHSFTARCLCHALAWHFGTLVGRSTSDSTRFRDPHGTWKPLGCRGKWSSKGPCSCSMLIFLGVCLCYDRGTTKKTCINGVTLFGKGPR